MRRFASTVITASMLLSGVGVASAIAAGPTSASHAGSTEVAVAPHTINLGLAGYSPVSYLQNNRAEPGSPRFSAEHDGVTYFFTSNRQRETFLASPERYLPAYGGFCAFGCSVDSKFIPDPTSFKVIGGRTHLFLNNDEVDAQELWNNANFTEVKAKADAYWSKQGESRAYIGGRNVPASGVGLEGYSPVSYFTTGRPEQGDPRFAVEHNGVTYHLTSAKQVEMFNENPDRYEPQCGGWCAFGMSVEDKFPVDPTKFKIIDDRLYLFLNNEQIDASSLWEQGDDHTLVRKSNSHWTKVSGE
ncbi:MAG: YHS domain-containing (seleno)protein [Phycisphaerales bacterium]